jgi:bifunctional N-acetylglucosamine-1-phosphate-uridyltransferase/glucosamine-1-phosphate-acetyltransferase GlmU-like protein
MDAVILAAGKGSRLEGVMAPYHKPLMVVNGRPIIWTAVHHALQVGANLVTVVVAPENALPISQVLMGQGTDFTNRLQLLVQQRPDGPGDALYRGLRIAHKGSPTRAKTLVLMGDNVTSFADIQKINQYPDFAIGVQYMDIEEAGRFTFYRHTESRWVEGLTPDSRDMDATGMVTCWVGPFVCPSDLMMSALENLRRDNIGEWKIGPAFNHVGGLEAAQVATQTTDIGTIDFAAKMTPRV